MFGEKIHDTLPFSFIMPVIGLCVSFFAIIFLLWITAEFLNFLGFSRVATIFYGLAKNLALGTLFIIGFGTVLVIGLTALQLLLWLLQYFQS